MHKEDTIFVLTESKHTSRNDPNYVFEPRHKGLTTYSGNYDGRVERLVATKSKKSAAKLLGISMYYFNTYFGETCNAEEMYLGLDNPGIVFESTMFKGRWKKVQKV